MTKLPTLKSPTQILLLAIASTAMLPALAQPLSAQAAVVEWTSVAKISNGTCADGAIAYISEKPGSMHLRLVYPNGQQYAEFDVALAPDGGGKTRYKTTTGGTLVDLEVPAGKGKRPMKTSQVTGICQYAWTPK